MSVRCQNWVWDHSDTTGNDRIVMLFIADQADDDGTNAFPGIDRIAAKTRLPKRTVMRCLERLESGGHLRVERPTLRGRGHHNSYVVVMDQGEPPMKGPAVLTPQARQAFLDSVESKECTYCEAPGTATHGPDRQPWQVDRIRPGAAGGTYVRGNMTLSCATCNRRKKDARSAPFIDRQRKVQKGRAMARNGAPPYVNGSRSMDPETQDPCPEDGALESDVTQLDPRAGSEGQEPTEPVDDLLAAVAHAAPPRWRGELLDDPDQAPGRAALRRRLVAIEALVGPESAVAVVAGEWPQQVTSAMAHANGRARAFLEGPSSRRPARAATPDPLDGISDAAAAIAERARARQLELADEPPLGPPPPAWKDQLLRRLHGATP